MAVGLVLVGLPLAINYAVPPGASAGAIRTAFLLAGFAAILLGGIGVATEATWGEWVIIALGVWLLAAPWVLGFDAAGPPKWVSLAAGLAAIVLAALSIAERQTET